MPFPKRHRAGDQMPKVVHLDPDPRAFALAEELVQCPAIQCVILGGSRHHGRWDDQSDLDTIIILEDSLEETEARPLANTALAELREKHYPGYKDSSHPDHDIGHGEIVVTMEYFLYRRNTVNDAMAQAAVQGTIFTEKAEDVVKYEHTGDTSREWELVTYPKLKWAADELAEIPFYKSFHQWAHRGFPHTVGPREGQNAYWLLWNSGSAVLSIAGVSYKNRSLVAMATSLKQNLPGWTHEFASDLECLDQYNGCSCEEVVLEPIQDMEAMWAALEEDRRALWRQIEARADFSIWNEFRVADRLEKNYQLLREWDYREKAAREAPSELLLQAGIRNSEVIPRGVRNEDELTKLRKEARDAGRLTSEENTELDRWTTIMRAGTGGDAEYLVFNTAVTADAGRVLQAARHADLLRRVTPDRCLPGLITDALDEETASCLDEDKTGKPVISPTKLNQRSHAPAQHEETTLTEEVLIIKIERDKARPYLLL